MKSSSLPLLMILVIIAFLATGTLVKVSWSSETKIQSTKKIIKKKGSNKMSEDKNLIVYYSRTGNTKAVAELIKSRVGGDLFQIETKDPRPKNYRDEVSKNVQEQDDNELPALKTRVPNFDEYKRIFIGTPTWNMALPQPIESFLDEYQFSGKTVIPFNTNGGYGEGSTFSQIKSDTKGANVLDGFSVKGGQEINGELLAIKNNRRVAVSKEVDKWLHKIGIKR